MKGLFCVCKSGRRAEQKSRGAGGEGDEIAEVVVVRFNNKKGRVVQSHPSPPPLSLAAYSCDSHWANNE